MSSQHQKAWQLAEAMQYLDDDILAEAHAETVGVSPATIHKRNLWKRLSLVACVCILAISLPYLVNVISQMGVGNMSGDSKPPTVGGQSYPTMDKEDGNGFAPEEAPEADAPNKPEEWRGVGSIQQSEYGQLSFVAETHTTLTLRLTISQTPTQPIHIYFYDYEGVIATTQEGYKDDGIIIREGRIKVLVNGEAHTGPLPCEIGTYDIVVDFAALRKDPIPMKEVCVVAGFSQIGRAHV